MRTKLLITLALPFLLLFAAGCGDVPDESAKTNDQVDQAMRDVGNTLNEQITEGQNYEEFFSNLGQSLEEMITEVRKLSLDETGASKQGAEELNKAVDELEANWKEITPDETQSAEDAEKTKVKLRKNYEEMREKWEDFRHNVDY